MLTLYMKSTCPFSSRVMGVAESLGIELELKDIAESGEYEQELEEKGGKHQTPYLIDDEKDFATYESQDIIDHLREHYSGGTDKAQQKSASRLHVGGPTCIACEG